ncbi:teichuronic acid biosynthesis protein TuaH [Mesobacillus foraminis]|uniref:Teichuronic acid biosynthesis glycosyltransferase TuaH n=1 Tax=Mesobacillus foraminis TaxID=279826 RepID=A0A4R2BHU1_9BACI|nr:glycosyltransferase [Mesobacillus foraminis]TCN26677.1 teichuronic acid biosynthesis glycosyltransferase TuaH [Mesobacillus foraminis]
MKNIHVIVATGEWSLDGLRYRRHRLAEFLQQQADSSEVIWVCPSPNPSEESCTTLQNGIKQWKITDLFPHKIFRFGRYLDQFYKSKLRNLLSYLKERQGQYKIHLWYTFPGFPLLTELFSWDKVIYDCSDLWSFPMSGKRSVLSTVRQTIVAGAENRILNSADKIFCTSQYLREQVAEKLEQNDHVYTFENGVEFDLFAGEQASAANILPEEFGGTVFGFIGGIKPKLDFRLIREAARRKPEWLFIFVGPDGTNGDQDFQQLLAEPNVKWTGSVPPSEVPHYMNLIDIGFMPYKPSPYNCAVFPLKLFEFLAAGKPVAGVSLPSTKHYQEEKVYEHLDSSEPLDFILACEKLEACKHDAEAIARRKQVAKTRDWQDVFAGMVALV